MAVYSVAKAYACELLQMFGKLSIFQACGL